MNHYHCSIYEIEAPLVDQTPKARLAELLNKSEVCLGFLSQADITELSKLRKLFRPKKARAVRRANTSVVTKTKLYADF